MRIAAHAILWTQSTDLPASASIWSRVIFLACMSGNLLMRAIFLAAITSVLLAGSCFAAPFVSGQITESLGRKTIWSVYDEFAIDNPLPSSGEFTYVYNVENVGAASFQLWQFGLIVDPDDLSSTGTLNIRLSNTANTSTRCSYRRHQSASYTSPSSSTTPADSTRRRLCARHKRCSLLQASAKSVYRSSTTQVTAIIWVTTATKI